MWSSRNLSKLVPLSLSMFLLMERSSLFKEVILRREDFTFWMDPPSSSSTIINFLVGYRLRLSFTLSWMPWVPKSNSSAMTSLWQKEVEL